MVIDAHQHFWKVGHSFGPRFEGGSVLNRDFLPAHIKPVRDSCGVQRTVAVQAAGSLDETRWLLQLAKKSAYIAGVVGWVDLTSPDVGQTLDELMTDSRLRGVSHPVEAEADPDWLVREDVVRGLRDVSRRGLTYDLLVRPRHLKHAVALADRVPDLRMVVDHLAKPSHESATMEEWSRDLAAVARVPSIYCKLSGIITEAPAGQWKPADFKPLVETVVELFGDDRVMFGSDWPACLSAGTYIDAYEVLVQALRPVSPEVFAKIFGRNAQNFYGLTDMEYFISPQH